MAEALLNKTKSMVTDHYQNANYLIQSFVFSFKQFINTSNYYSQWAVTFPAMQGGGGGGD